MCDEKEDGLRAREVRAAATLKHPHKPTVERCGSRRGRWRAPILERMSSTVPPSSALPSQGFRKTLGGVLDRFPALPSVPLRLVYSSGSGGYHIELAQLNAILTKHNRDHEGRSI